MPTGSHEARAVRLAGQVNGRISGGRAGSNGLKRMVKGGFPRMLAEADPTTGVSASEQPGRVLDLGLGR